MMARLTAPSLITHDFTSTPACTISLTLELYHELPGELHLRWGTSKKHQGNESATSGEPLQGQRFIWTGTTSAMLPAVVPATVVKIPLRIAVTSPGWVSVDGCWVEWSCKEVPQLNGGQSIPACCIQVETLR